MEAILMETTTGPILMTLFNLISYTPTPDITLGVAASVYEWVKGTHLLP